MTRTRHSGFSLVELSIVLVILGLLTGGILAGQSLIRAAELRSVSTDYQRYRSAIYAFRDKYFQLPGDFNNATAFWGAQDPTPATCQTTASSSALTCNGNGDNSIGDSTAYYERFRFWQHLANAGLIEGQYNGVTGSGSAYDATIGVNVPRSRIANAGFSMIGKGTAPGTDANFFPGYFGNVFTFGAKRLNDITVDPILKPEEAWNIDTKLDDGIPGTGNVQAMISTSTITPGCTTTASSSTSAYALSSSTVLCDLMLKSGT